MSKSQSIQADCIDVMRDLPDNYFYLTIADPPYFTGPEKRKFYGRAKSPIGVQRVYEKSDAWELPTPAYFEQLQRVSQNLVVFGVNYYDYHFGNGRIVWDKCNSASSFSDCEIAYCSMWDSVRLFRYMWNGMLQGKSITEGHIMQGDKRKNEVRIHPTQKPVALYDWLFIKCKAETGARVFDPYSGSQSMRISAFELGLDYVGTEKDIAMYKKANERFDLHIAQQSFLRGAL